MPALATAAATAATAMIVDDESPMRDQLRARLQQTWPDLSIIAEAANGIVAIGQAEKLHPDIIFLDIRMPGKNGIEAASILSKQALVVFVTAYDEYAIQAFERGAMDYLLKPVEADRLAGTCQRLQERLKQRQQEKEAPTNAANDQAKQVEQMLTQLMQQQSQKREYLRWIQASVGANIRMIPTSDILFFRAEDKYTRVQTRSFEALIRKPIKELI